MDGTPTIGSFSSAALDSARLHVTVASLERLSHFYEFRVRVRWAEPLIEDR